MVNIMISKKAIVAMIALGPLLFTACDPDNFSQVVDIDIPEHDPKLVLNARFDDQAHSLSVLLSNSLGILDTAQYSLFPQATVRLFADDVLAGEFQFDPNASKFITLLDVPLSNSGGLYRLEASTPGFGPVFAEQRMPVPVEIESVVLERDGAVSEEGEKADEIKIQFTDPAGQDNYYAVRVEYLARTVVQPGDTVEYSYPLYTSTLDQVVRSGNEFDHLFPGQSFDGTRYTLSLYSEGGIDFDDPNGRVKAYLYSLTREGYLYDLSLSQYFDTVDNPFAEPATVFSNIEGGYGAFTLRAIAEKEVPVQ